MLIDSQDGTRRVSDWTLTSVFCSFFESQQVEPSVQPLWWGRSLFSSTIHCYNIEKVEKVSSRWVSARSYPLPFLCKVLSGILFFIPSSRRHIWWAPFFRDEETKSWVWHGMAKTPWLRSSPTGTWTLVFQQMPCPICHLLLHGCLPSSRKAIKAWQDK